jgi:anti-sigma factor RsiW
MGISDEVLMAYADGEADSKTRALVEEAMAADPQIARRIAEHRALRNTLRSSYDNVLAEPVPDRLLAAARARASPQKGGLGAVKGLADHRDASREGPGHGVVVPLRPKRTRTPPMYWGAIAASFVVGGLVWHFGAELLAPGPVMERGGQLLASGALDKALSTQLVRDQQAQSAVQIGVSFRSKAGSYCRTFQLRDNNLAGLACREQGNWKLEMLALTGSSPAGQPEFRQAGSSLPPAIAQAVDQAIDGDPLDAEAEARARTNRWQ